MLYKKCRICEDILELENFHKKKANKDGYRNECKECVKGVQKKYKELPGFKEKQKEYDKKRYQEKKDKILERKREYHTENREKILKDKKKYREENPDKIREWRKNNPDKNSNGQARYREKYPHAIAWRSILHSTLKRLGTRKSGRTIDELGYSADELKEHIESQFLPGMSWDNHGDWHLDHKIPVTKFDPKTSVSEVCALDNLQPLWAIDNLEKSNKF